MTAILAWFLSLLLAILGGLTISAPSGVAAPDGRDGLPTRTETAVQHPAAVGTAGSPDYGACLATPDPVWPVCLPLDACAGADAATECIDYGPVDAATPEAPDIPCPTPDPVTGLTDTWWVGCPVYPEATP